MRRASSLVGALLIGLPLVLGADASRASGREARPMSRSHASGSRGHATHKSKASKKRAMRSHPSERRNAEPADAAPSSEPRRARGATLSILPNEIACPPDMVAVAGRVCVDRYETSLVDRGTRRAWPPTYAPNPERAATTASFYELLREKSPPMGLGAQMPIPAPPTFAIEAEAVSLSDATPQGYLTADVAESACRAAGKRLCSESEWLTACRGEGVTDFPYGDHYEQGVCNVYRESHPSFLLHDNAARYHDDPRNNLVTFEGRPLLQKTGASPRCASRWGSDAVYDMVGNLDEWIADEGGVFVGGFYSRGTRSGCFSRVSNHPRTYSDYSTGARCCADPSPSR